MTIFQKIAAAIDRFKKTADRMGHIDLADALNDQNYVAEWLEQRIRKLEKAADITLTPLPVRVVATATTEIKP